MGIGEVGTTRKDNQMNLSFSNEIFLFLLSAILGRQFRGDIFSRNFFLANITKNKPHAKKVGL